MECSIPDYLSQEYAAEDQRDLRSSNQVTATESTASQGEKIASDFRPKSAESCYPDNKLVLAGVCFWVCISNKKHKKKEQQQRVKMMSAQESSDSPASAQSNSPSIPYPSER